ncbi:MAG TPA: DUF1015 family protein, partial [Spirochaetota bacterium]
FGKKNLYIADGHHRAASAVKVGQAKRAAAVTPDPKAEYNWVLSVVFPHDELMIMPYNRVVKDLNGLDEKGLVSRISEKFNVTEGAPVPARKQSFSMYLGRKWYTLSPKFEISADPVASLDVSIMQNEILSPILGIDNPRTSKRIDFIGGIRGTDELERLVNDGSHAVAFSMFATTIEDLIAVSDAGSVMPPKSTWFEPKLRSGLVMHRI